MYCDKITFIIFNSQPIRIFINQKNERTSKVCLLLKLPSGFGLLGSCLVYLTFTRFKLWLMLPALPFLLLAQHFHLKHMLKLLWFSPPALTHCCRVILSELHLGLCLLPYWHFEVASRCSQTIPSQQCPSSTSLSFCPLLFTCFGTPIQPFPAGSHLRIKSQNLKHSLHVMNQFVSCVFRMIRVMYLPWKNWGYSHSKSFLRAYFSPRSLLRRLLQWN